MSTASPSHRIDDRDWSALSTGERIRQLEVEGYLVLPDLLDADQIAALKQETSQLETKAVDYSDRQRYCPHLEFRGGRLTDLVAHPPTIAFLQALMGEGIVMMSFVYARSEPGHPGISLHADGQPYGSEIFGFEGSCPWLVRVLYYLDDLTPEVSPFRVVPHSHISMHPDANPYLRYERHPEEVMVPCRAGSAVLINHRVFHGNFPNTGERPRELLAIGYRPTWAGPIDTVDEWDADEVAKLPDHVRPFFGSRNSREWDFHGGNKPASMKSEASGMNPSRWSLP
jgi:ectoine hydroxylase-related dioxygenase (phytanoyl-CoA dioxygenase family)